MVVDASFLDLGGKVAVVTGAAQGIGAAIAQGFAACGADVAICDRDARGLAETAGLISGRARRCMTAELDVRDSAAVGEFAARIGSEFERVDVLVNNAGGGFKSPFSEVSTKGVQVLIDENFLSVVHFLRAFDPLLAEGGSVINVTSVEAFHAAPGFAVYGSMKAAVEQLTRTLAAEWGGRRIRVNTIAPDRIPTPGRDGSIADLAQSGGWTSRPPLGVGHVDDCAGAALFLASRLSNFVTGSTINVDGGSIAAGNWHRDDQGNWRP